MRNVTHARPERTRGPTTRDVTIPAIAVADGVTVARVLPHREPHTRVGRIERVSYRCLGRTAR
jgi:hypothetical protein